MSSARLFLVLSMTVVLLSGCDEQPTAPMPRDRTETSSTREAVAQEELVHRLRTHVEELATGPERSWRRPERLAQLADRIEGFWLDLGFRTERMEIPGMGPNYVNVLAFPPNISWQEEPYILGAHYDVVDGTPGADDNASGVAVLLETSRLLAGAEPLPVVFVAFTLEEPPFFLTPRQGSRVLVEQLRSNSAQIRGAVVLEMVGYYRQEPGSQAFPFPLGYLGYPDTGNFCGIIANWRSRKLVGPLKSAIGGAGLPVESLVVPGKGGLLEPIRFSDHASFWDRDYPAVMLTDTAFYRNPHYHGPGDTPNTLDYASMAKLATALMEFLQNGVAPMMNL